MTYDDLIRHYGTQAEAAKALGIPARSLLSWWKKHGIPGPRQFEIAAKTGGALAVDPELLEPRKSA